MRSVLKARYTCNHPTTGTVLGLLASASEERECCVFMNAWQSSGMRMQYIWRMQTTVLWDHARERGLSPNIEGFRMQRNCPCGHACAICLSGLGKIRTEAVNAARGSSDILILRNDAMVCSFHTQYDCLIASSAQPLSSAREHRPFPPRQSRLCQWHCKFSQSSELSGSLSIAARLKQSFWRARQLHVLTSLTTAFVVGKVSRTHQLLCNL